MPFCSIGTRHVSIHAEDDVRFTTVFGIKAIQLFRYYCGYGHHLQLRVRLLQVTFDPSKWWVWAAIIVLMAGMGWMAVLMLKKEA